MTKSDQEAPMTDVLIALGSNLGERRAQLAQAIDELGAVMDITAQSRLYQTAPMYVSDQPAFLNMAVRGVTALAPIALLDRLKAIEEALGRAVSFRNGPRAIDLDILAFGEHVLDSERLTIPHPRLAERAFVLVPLMDIAAEWVDPSSGAKIAALLEAVPGRETVVPADPPQL
jgi:2-amino-4-hydroxy-6-hydroxymethyldihydropteridine diphosphokinase